MPLSTRTMQPEDWRLLEYFTPAEFRHPEKMGFQFMLKLDRLRREAGVPCPISSDWRSRAHNQAVGGAADSAHCDEPICEAADINPPDSGARFQIVRAAYVVGFERIGIYQNGSVHVDATGDRRPNRVLWHVVSHPA